LISRKSKQSLVPPILLLMPAIYFLSYVSCADGAAARQSNSSAPVFSSVLDHRRASRADSYAYDPMQARGGLESRPAPGIGLGAHPPPGECNARPQAGSSGSFYSIALRILIAWIYTTGRSVSAAVLVHTDNPGWALFPNYGSHYNRS
jgi:hypothetical protein